MSEKRLTIIILTIQKYLNKYYPSNNINYYDLFGVDESLSREDILKFLKENKYKACFHPDNLNSLPEYYRPYYEEVCKLYTLFEDMVNNKKTSSYQNTNKQSNKNTQQSQTSYSSSETKTNSRTKANSSYGTKSNTSSYSSGSNNGYNSSNNQQYSTYTRNYRENNSTYQSSYEDYKEEFDINKWGKNNWDELIPEHIIKKFTRQWKEKHCMDSAIFRKIFEDNYYLAMFYHNLCDALKPTIYEYGIQKAIEGLQSYYISACYFILHDNVQFGKGVNWDKFTLNEASRLKMQALDYLLFKEFIDEIKAQLGFSLEEIFNSIMFSILAEQEKSLCDGLRSLRSINPNEDIAEYIKKNIFMQEYLFLMNFELGNIKYIIKPQSINFDGNDINILINEYLKQRVFFGKKYEYEEYDDGSGYYQGQSDDYQYNEWHGYGM